MLMRVASHDSDSILLLVTRREHERNLPELRLFDLKRSTLVISYGQEDLEDFD